ncbi:MAG: DoxX family protein [Clostridia bacterium]|nr:DoxX family protein [Clostridia bacterium]
MPQGVRHVRIDDPPFARYVFGSTRFAWFWLLVRVYVGYQWLAAGWHKVTSPAWMAGEELQAFWTRVTAVPEPPARPAITYGWYREFLRTLLDNGTYTWFADLVAWGEVLVGAALIAGAFTGIAAFFGSFMNFNFMLAGTASTNPVLFALGIALMLAWKTAGWWGLDRWLLPALGTPWTPHEVGGREAAAARGRVP